jgi:hypothetical protein
MGETSEVNQRSFTEDSKHDCWTNVPEWFRIFLLGETKSPKAADELIKTIEHQNPAIRSKSVWATSNWAVKLLSL